MGVKTFTFGQQPELQAAVNVSSIVGNCECRVYYRVGEQFTLLKIISAV
jgi:hypothetical protein